jgi:hypothetical protein
VPRSLFLGRPLPGPGEPLWTEDDRAWALALLQVEAEACTGCGQILADSTNPDSEGRWTAEVLRCHACTTAAHHAEKFQQAGGDGHGAHVRVYRKEDRRD